MSVIDTLVQQFIQDVVGAPPIGMRGIKLDYSEDENVGRFYYTGEDGCRIYITDVSSTTRSLIVRFRILLKEKGALKADSERIQEELREGERHLNRVLGDMTELEVKLEELRNEAKSTPQVRMTDKSKGKRKVEAGYLKAARTPAPLVQPSWMSLSSSRSSKNTRKPSSTLLSLMDRSNNLSSSSGSKHSFPPSSPLPSSSISSKPYSSSPVKSSTAYSDGDVIDLSMDDESEALAEVRFNFSLLTDNERGPEAEGSTRKMKKEMHRMIRVVYYYKDNVPASVFELLWDRPNLFRFTDNMHKKTLAEHGFNEKDRIQVYSPRTDSWWESSVLYATEPPLAHNEPLIVANTSVRQFFLLQRYREEAMRFIAEGEDCEALGKRKRADSRVSTLRGKRSRF